MTYILSQTRCRARQALLGTHSTRNLKQFPQNRESQKKSHLTHSRDPWTEPHNLTSRIWFLKLPDLLSPQTSPEAQTSHTASPGPCPTAPCPQLSHHIHKGAILAPNVHVTNCEIPQGASGRGHNSLCLPPISLEYLVIPQAKLNIFICFI